jgi:tRNA(Ile)-lysidine synthase
MRYSLFRVQRFLLTCVIPLKYAFRMPSYPTIHRQNGYGKKILNRVSRTMEENAMVQPGDSVLVAVSGGADSVALIHILKALTPILSVRLAIAHLNHDLRLQESERDAEFVASLAHNLQLPLYLEKIDVRGYRERHRQSPEEAARNVRYDFLNQVAEKNGFTKIAVGHHLDDNAELVLMFLLRGSGPLGISGMPPVRDAKIIRPLIDIKRSEILDYLAQKELQYVSDSSNTNRGYLRNRIRHDLIPDLASNYNPNIVETLNRLASLVRSEDRWMETLVEPIFKSALMKQDADIICLSLKILEDVPLAAGRRVIRTAIKKVKGNLRRVAFSHIDAVIRLAIKGPVTGSIDLPDRIQVRRDRRALIITKQEQPLRIQGRSAARTTRAGYAYEISTPGTVFIKEAGAHFKLTEMNIEAVADINGAGQQLAFFDISKLKCPLLVRNFCPGDRFSPLGMTGTQKLKDFFINNKISRDQRVICPLLISRDKIIWVAGYRMDNSVKVDAETRHVLKAELLLA